MCFYSQEDNKFFILINVTNMINEIFRVCLEDASSFSMIWRWNFKCVSFEWEWRKSHNLYAFKSLRLKRRWKSIINNDYRWLEMINNMIFVARFYLILSYAYYTRQLRSKMTIFLHLLLISKVLIWKFHDVFQNFYTSSLSSHQSYA